MQRLSLPARALSRGIRHSSSGNGLPGNRLPKLRSLLRECKDDRVIRVMETHNGLTGLIAETATATRADGEVVEFDGFWSSSLTASAAHGKPDIETVDTTARLRLVEETLAVTTKPLIYDADTGGHAKVFAFTVQTLERLGASMAIIEDKTGLKQNSLFGTDRKQQLEDIPTFQGKIAAGQAAKRDADFMITARLEALIAGYGEAEALKRAEAFIEAGADSIMIHSKEKDPAEVLSFLDGYHKLPTTVPVVVVPTTYNVLTEKDLHEAGASICIYANQMLRAAYPSMVECVTSILEHGRSQEIDSKLLSVKEILVLIDEGAGKGKA